jgi:hypothetical protein
MCESSTDPRTTNTRLTDTRTDNELYTAEEDDQVEDDQVELTLENAENLGILSGLEASLIWKQLQRLI